MWYSAVVIVGTHGASLSNMLFSEPGTYVVEGVCNPPHVNMCFRLQAHLLGHHWRGIMEGTKCPKAVAASAASVNAVVRSYLRLYEINKELE